MPEQACINMLLYTRKIKPIGCNNSTIPDPRQGCYGFSCTIEVNKNWKKIQNFQEKGFL